MKIISRKEAKALNLKRYFIGKPCKNGHISEREVGNGKCFECRREYRREHYANHREEISKYKKEYNANHKEKRGEYSKEYYANHKEERREYNKEYRVNRKEEIAEYGREYRVNHKEKIAEYRVNHKEEIAEYHANHKEEKAENNREYRKNNPGKIRASNANRRAAKKQRIPFWADLDAIKEFYEQCPDGYHVDHVIPLQGELVSGLHVAENLQYLTPSENSRKHNKFEIL